VVSFKSRPLYPWDRSPRYHWRGGGVGTAVGVNAVAIRKTSKCPRQEFGPSRPARSVDTTLTELPRLARGMFSDVAGVNVFLIQVLGTDQWLYLVTEEYKLCKPLRLSPFWTVPTQLYLVSSSVPRSTIFLLKFLNC